MYCFYETSRFVAKLGTGFSKQNTEAGQMFSCRKANGFQKAQLALVHNALRKAGGGLSLQFEHVKEKCWVKKRRKVMRLQKIKP